MVPSSRSLEAVELDRCLVAADADVVSSCVEAIRDCSEPAGVIGLLISSSDRVA
jgi:hypothetical protein